VNLLLGLGIGAAFGAVLVVSGLADARRIFDMLRLRDLTLMKTIFAALAVGMAGVALLDAAGLAHTGVKSLHVIAIALGGVLFGLGFALTGYCPGSALAASAQGRRDAWATVAGGLAGTAAFAALYDVLAPAVVEPLTFGKPTLATWLGVPAPAVALPLAGAVALALWLASRGGRGGAAEDRPTESALRGA
jgi:hypothetical protein